MTRILVYVGSFLVMLNARQREDSHRLADSGFAVSDAIFKTSAQSPNGVRFLALFETLMKSHYYRMSVSTSILGSQISRDRQMQMHLTA